MPVQNNHAGPTWRRVIICLAMMALLLAGIHLHALQFGSTTTAVSSDHQSRTKRQSFDTDATYCVAPPRIFAFEPAPAVFFRVVQGQDVFLPAHPDGWYCNRPPPSF
jgi:hypothetical protein